MAVGQNLVVLPALSSPVKLTDSNTLAANMSAMTNLGLAGLRTISILGRIYQLNAAGGKDYRTNHAGAIQDAKILFGGISLISGQMSQNKALIEAAIDWGDGESSDAAGLSNSVNTLLAEGRDFLELPVETLERILLMLKYRLGV